MLVVVVQSLSLVLLFATPWTTALRAPLFMGFATNTLADIFTSGRTDENVARFLLMLAFMIGAYLLNALLSYIATWTIVGVFVAILFCFFC